MPPKDPKNSRVRVSLTETGTYNLVGMTRSWGYTEGSEGGTVLRWLGGDATKAGAPNLSGTIEVWNDMADPTGQQVLTSAKRNGTQVWLQVCPDGTATGAKVEQFQATIGERGMTGDAEGDGVEGSFSYTGAPSTLTTVTLA